MALSDIIKKIEDSPRSTKVAVGAVGIAVAACAIAVFTLINRPDYTPQPTPAAKVAVETRSDTRTAPPPAVPQPTFPPVPTNTPSPVPTNTPIPSPTPKTSKTVAAVPTVIPTPRATATPEANDDYVVIHSLDPDDDIGWIDYYDKEYAGTRAFFKEEDFFLNYLVQEGVITPEQRKAYFNGEEVVIPLISIATAYYKLHQTDNYKAQKLGMRVPEKLLHHADKSSLASNRSVAPTPEANDGYTVINQRTPGNDIGWMTHYTTEHPGLSGPFKEEDFFLNYLVQEGVITPEQRNAYFNGEDVVVPFISVANAYYKLHQTDNYKAQKVQVRTPEILLHYADKSSVDSNRIGKISFEDDEGYRVTIEDGRVSVSGTDAQGNTTTVSVEGESAQTLIERWLRENKITIEQSDELGQTGKLEFSLDDAVDFSTSERFPKAPIYKRSWRDSHAVPRTGAQK